MVWGGTTSTSVLDMYGHLCSYDPPVENLTSDGEDDGHRAIFKMQRAAGRTMTQSSIVTHDISRAICLKINDIISPAPSSPSLPL